MYPADKNFQKRSEREKRQREAVERIRKAAKKLSSERDRLLGPKKQRGYFPRTRNDLLPVP
jgi:hypothetical protein